MPSPAVLAVCDVRKKFGQLTAVDGVSFEVARGECFGLLGPNGAGKTTTLSMVSTLVRPDSGRVVVAGFDAQADPRAVRRALGLVPQDLSLYGELTARENLEFFGKLFGLKGAPLAGRVDEALELAGLRDRAGDRVDTFSGGMKRRLNFVVGFIHAPELILLDEPTVGVDPQSRNHLFDMVTRLKQRGVTLVYTTHYMEEAERLCDRIGIMDHGKLAAIGTRDELLSRLGARDQLDLVLPEDAGAQAADLGTVLAGFSPLQRDGTWTMTVAGVADLQQVLQRCEARGIRPRSVTLRKPDLEAVFLSLTGRALRD